MAMSKPAYFDERGHLFRTPEEATQSDIAALLGRIGEGDSLAPGIAKTLFEKRRDIETIFADHDAMLRGVEAPALRSGIGKIGNVTPLTSAKVA
jgi:hypothetical protein